MKRLMAVMWMLWPLILLGQAPPVLRQPFTTNAAVPVMLLATNVATNSVRLAIGPNVTITEAGTAGGFTYTIGAALIGGGASLSDVTNRITSVMLTNDGAQVVAYVIGANGTNFVYSIGANGTNFTYAIGANSTNFTYLIGANGTNFALTIGLACTNQGNAYSVALSNLCYVIGSNGTNFTYAVGANGTNFSLTVGLACTNQGNSYSVALSNLCYVIGANSTNFTYSIGANGTNFAYLLGANSTNFTYSIGANGTNFSYLIGANGTNFGYAIGASATNHVNWLSNLLATAFPKIAVTNLVADNMTVTNITNSGYIVLGGTPRNTWPSGSTISIQGNGGVPLSGIDMVNFIHNTNMGVFVTSGGGSVGNVTFNSKFTIQTNTVNAFAGATTLNLIQGANVSFLSTNRGTTNDLQLIATGGGGGGGDLYFSKMSASQFTTNGSVVIIKTEADLTNIIHHGNVLFTNDTSFSMVLDPDLNNSSEIVFNQRGLVIPNFRIYANSDGDRLRFYNSGNLMMDLAGNIVIYTNLYVRNDLHVGGAIFTNPPILLEPLTNRPLFLGPHHGVTNGWVDMPMLESTVTSASNSVKNLNASDLLFYHSFKTMTNSYGDSLTNFEASSGHNVQAHLPTAGFNQTCYVTNGWFGQRPSAYESVYLCAAVTNLVPGEPVSIGMRWRYIQGGNSSNQAETVFASSTAGLTLMCATNGWPGFSKVVHAQQNSQWAYIVPSVFTNGPANAATMQPSSAALYPYYNSLDQVTNSKVGTISEIQLWQDGTMTCVMDGYSTNFWHAGAIQECVGTNFIWQISQPSWVDSRRWVEIESIWVRRLSMSREMRASKQASSMVLSNLAGTVSGNATSIVGSGSVTVSSNAGVYTIGYAGSGITLSDVTNGTPFGFDASVGTAGDFNSGGIVTAGGTNIIAQLSNLVGQSNVWALLSWVNAVSNRFDGFSVANTNHASAVLQSATNYADFWIDSSANMLRSYADSTTNGALANWTTVTTNKVLFNLSGKGTNTYLTNAIIQSASATNLATYGTATSDTTNGPIQLVRGDWATNIAAAAVSPLNGMTNQFALAGMSNIYAQAWVSNFLNAVSNRLDLFTTALTNNTATVAGKAVLTNLAGNVSQGYTNAAIINLSGNVSHAYTNASIINLAGNVSQAYTNAAIINLAGNVSQAYTNAVIVNLSGNVSQAYTNANTIQWSALPTNVLQNPNSIKSGGFATGKIPQSNAGVWEEVDMVVSGASRQGGTAGLTNLNTHAQTLTNLAGMVPLTLPTNIVGAGVAQVSSNGGVYTINVASASGPAIVTNSIWVPAGAMTPYGGSTADGTRSGATAGSFTNVVAVDVWDFDDTVNECVAFNWQPGYGFAGGLTASFYWLTTNTLNPGLTNIVWDLGVSILESNALLSANTYQTNGTFRFWSSNSVQISKLPLITTAAATVDSLLCFRVSRLGTNTADAAVGDIRFIGARIGYTQTNWVGGYP